MQLPKYKFKKRTKVKICQEPSCGIEYIGHPISKYCELHQNVRMRIRKRRKFENINVKNQTLKHSYTECVDMEFICALPGCEQSFKTKIFPKQHTYPKYCEEHRSEYKRELFLREHKNGKMS